MPGSFLALSLLGHTRFQLSLEALSSEKNFAHSQLSALIDLAVSLWASVKSGNQGRLIYAQLNTSEMFLQL